MTRCYIAQSLLALRLPGIALAATPSPQTPTFSDRAATAPGAVPLTRESASALFTRFDALAKQLAQTTAGWEAIASWPLDFRKATVASDIAKYVLPGSVKLQLAQQRRDAQRQFDGGDWPGAVFAINTAYGTLTDKIGMLRAVVSYWRNRPSYDARIAAWENTLKQNHLDDTRSAPLRSLLAALNEDASQGKFLAIMEHDYPALDSEYEAAIDNARTAAGGTLIGDSLRRAGAARCQDSDDASAYSRSMQLQSVPRVAIQRSKPTDTYYPPYAQRLGAQGVTTVRVLVTRSGCVQWAEVAKSSGVIVLDDSALDWASKAAGFDPAIADGHPVQMATEFNVRFRLDPCRSGRIARALTA